MKNVFLRFGFIGLMSLTLSLSLSAQGRQGAPARGARGEQPQGQRGERGQRGQGPNAEQRKAIQERTKAALEQENQSFRLTMQGIMASARDAKDANARAAVKAQREAAQRNHQEALKRIRAEGQSALNALKQQ
jgi:hypothetical protein